MLDYPGNFSIEYQRPADINVIVNDSFSIGIIFGVEMKIPFIVRKELHPRQFIRLCIKCANPTRYKEFARLNFTLQNFLTLATCEEVFPLEVVGILENYEQVGDEKPIQHEVKIYYIPISKVRQEKDVYPHQMLFAYTDIEDKFGNILKNWVEKEEILRPSYNLYFAVRYKSSLFSENKFLNFAQALETFYSRLDGREYLPESDYKEVYQELVRAIPDLPVEGYAEFKSSLIQRLKYINEFSLRRKLKT
jgi:hypothetical protein